MPEPCNFHDTINPRLVQIKKKILIVPNHVPMKKPEGPRTLFIWLALSLIMNLLSLNFTPAFLHPLVRINGYMFS